MWFPMKFLAQMWVMMGLREVWMFGLGMLVGAALAWRQRPGRFCSCSRRPIVAAMVAAIIRQFPFGQRLLALDRPDLRAAARRRREPRGGVAEELDCAWPHWSRARSCSPRPS